MEKIILEGKEIKIRKLAPRDLANSKGFVEYLNLLVKEGAYIDAYKKVGAREEKEWLNFYLKKQRSKRAIFLVSEFEGKIISNASVRLYDRSWDHEAELNIDVSKDFRCIGLGSHLIKELIARSSSELKPKPVRLILGAMSENKIAIDLYEKLGFKKIAVIPEQHHYKKRFIDEIIMVLYL